MGLPTGDLSSSAPYAGLITSEHNQKPNFMSVVSVLTAGIADTTNLIQSLPNAFNLNGDAVGAQLDILGLWIGQSRIIDNILVAGYFGFSEASSGLPDGLQLPFGELTNISIGGLFYDLGDASSSTSVLSDPGYLTVLRARICRNQSNGTLSALENALEFIFGVGCSVADPGTLKLSINVSEPITPLDQALLSSLDILPRPAGVQIVSITYTA
jgi:hypothetical protein